MIYLRHGYTIEKKEFERIAKKTSIGKFGVELCKNFYTHDELKMYCLEKLTKSRTPNGINIRQRFPEPFIDMLNSK